MAARPFAGWSGKRPRTSASPTWSAFASAVRQCAVRVFAPGSLQVGEDARELGRLGMQEVPGPRNGAVDEVGRIARELLDGLRELADLPERFPPELVDLIVQFALEGHLVPDLGDLVRDDRGVPAAQGAREAVDGADHVAEGLGLQWRGDEKQRRGQKDHEAPADGGVDHGRTPTSGGGEERVAGEPDAEPVAGPDRDLGEPVEEAAHHLLAAGGGPLADAGLEAGEPAGVGAAADGGEAAHDADGAGREEGGDVVAVHPVTAARLRRSG